jgi:parallel beta-helix repeat protein
MKLRIGLLITALLLVSIANAALFVAGDISPRGNTDGVLDAADALLLQRFLGGYATPDDLEKTVVDVAPLGGGNGVVDVADYLILLRAIRGDIVLPPISIGPNVPVLSILASPVYIAQNSFSGSADNGATVRIYLNNSLVSTVTASAIDGSFSASVTLGFGANAIHTTAFDGESESANSNVVNVDYIFTTPVISDAGNSANVNPFSINGAADGNTSLRIYLNGEYQQAITTDATGNFSASVYLTHGANSITVRAWDGFIETVDSNSIAADFTDSSQRTLNESFIGQDTVWTPGASNQVYALTRYLIVPQGVTLTIMPGTRVEYDSTTENIGLQVQGTIKVLGTVTNPVVFTSSASTKAKGDWPGLMFTGTSTNSEVQHAVFEYARNAVFVWSNGDVTVRDSVFRNYSNAGVYADSNSSGVIENNLFDNIDQLPVNSVSVTTVGAGVQLRDASFTIANNEFTQTSLGIYQSGGTVTIAGNNFHDMPTGIWLSNSGTSTINQGNVFTATDTGIYMSGDATNLTNPQPVINNNNFYNNNVVNIIASNFVNGADDLIDATQNWWGTSDPRNIIQTIADSQNGTNFILTNPPTFNYGSYLGAQNDQPVYENWIVSDITSDRTLNAGQRYEVFNTINVSSGATLTVPAGTELHFVNNDGLTLDGNLVTQGTLQQPVVFTSNANSPNSNSWQGITANGASSQITLNYTQMSYASNAINVLNGSANITNSIFDQNNIAVQFASGSNGSVIGNSFDNGNTGLRITGANPVVQANTIQNQTFGVYLNNGASPTINTGNTITENNYGIYALGDGVSANNNPLPVVNGNNISNNSNYNYFANNYVSASSVILNSRDNWWGANTALTVAATIYDNGSSALAPLVDYGRYFDVQNGSPVFDNSIIGTLTADLNILENEVYEVIDELVVPSGITLTMAAGSQLSFPSDVALTVLGTLNVNGDSTNKTVMTSTAISPIAGSWKGIVVEAGGSVNVDHTILRYADRGIDFNSASGSVSNTEVRDSVYGIYLLDSSPSISANTIHDNTYGLYITGLSNPVVDNGNDITLNNYGLYVQGGSAVADQNPAPVVTANSIHLNTVFNYYADNFFAAESRVLVATDNYWGNANPLMVAQTIRDRSEDVTDAPYVDYGHYLNAQNGSIVKNNYLLGLVSGVISDASESYEVLSDLSVAQGQSLQIQQGVQLDFISNYQLIVNGTLDVQGTLAQPVLFTTAQAVKDMADWKGILINSTATNVSIDYAVVEYANRGLEFISGNGSVTNSQFTNNNTAIYVSGAGANPSITNNNVITGNLYGLYVSGDGAVGNNPNPVLTGNIIHSNTTYNYFAGNFYTPDTVTLNATNNWWNQTSASLIALTILDNGDNNSAPFVNYGQYLNAQGGSPVNQNSLIGSINGTLNIAQGADYEILGDLNVANGQSLVIEAGVNLLFDNNQQFVVNGDLDVQGTVLNPVVMSATGISKNAWPGIVVSASAGTVSIDNARIENATRGIEFNTAANLSNSIFINNTYGVYINAASPQITSSSFTDNTTGIYIYGASSPTINAENTITNNATGIYIVGSSSTVDQNPGPLINNNSIYSNSSYNTRFSGSYYQPNAYKVDMKNNWWGSTVASDISNTIYDFSNSLTMPVADYSDFLDFSGGTAITGNYLIGAFEGVSPISVAVANDYQVLGRLYVPAGVTVNIEAGSVFNFQGNFNIEVDGTLNVNGDAVNRVIFTSDGLTWQGIKFNDSSQNGSIQNADIHHATTAIRNDNADLTVQDSVITRINNGIAIDYSNNATGLITRNLILNGLGDTPGTQGTGVRLNNSSPTISYNVIMGMSYGIYLTGTSNPTIEYNLIVSNSRGIYLSGTSNDATSPRPIIQNNDLFSNTYGLTISGYSVDSSIILDISNNWWGSSTPVLGTDYLLSNSAASIMNNLNPSAAALTSPVATAASTTETYISPANIDAIKDLTTYSATVSETTAWNMSIRNSGGSVVRSFTGTGTAINQVWNGQNTGSTFVDDGIYYIYVETTGANGTLRSGFKEVFVDNTAPDSIFNMTNGANLSASPFLVMGTANDALALENYTLQVANGLTPLDVDFNNVTTSTGNVINSVLANWTFGDMDTTLAQLTGDKTLRLTVVDKAGNTSVSTIQVSLDHISISGVVQSVASITPVLNEEVTINFTLGRAANVFVRFYPEQGGDMVAELNQTFATAGAQSINWNGMGLNGVFLTDDAYRFEIYAESGADNTLYSISGNDAATGSGGNLGGFGPHQNNYWKATFVATTPGRVRLSHGGVYPIDQAIDVGTHNLLWDYRDAQGRILNSAMFLPGATFTGLRSHSVIVKGNNPVLVGTGTAPNIEIKSDPYRVMHSYNQISQIAYQVDQDSTVTVKLLPPCLSTNTTCSTDFNDAEAVVIVNNVAVSAETLGVPDTHTFEWRGYDVNASTVDSNNILVDEDGTYTYMIQATSVASGLSTLYRGSLQIYK